MRVGLQGNVEISAAIEKEPEEGRQQTELWHMTRADALQLSGIPGPKSTLAVIKINALQVMYGEDAFEPYALLYCFGTKVKHWDAALVQIQEIVDLLGGAITCDGGSSFGETEITAGCHRAGVRSHLGHSPHPGRTRWPSFNMLGPCIKTHSQFFQLPIREEKKGGSIKVMGNKSKLVEMLNREKPPC